MAVLTDDNSILNGGEFIIKSSSSENTFCPEDFSEEQKMIRETVEDFNKTEIYPNIEKIEKQENDIAASLLDKFGALGLLGTHMPEDFGGMDMDFNTNTIIGESVGPSGSFSVAYNAHTGIGMLPILYFGTEATILVDCISTFGLTSRWILSLVVPSSPQCHCQSRLHDPPHSYHRQQTLRHLPSGFSFWLPSFL